MSKKLDDDFSWIPEEWIDDVSKKDVGQIQQKTVTHPGEKDWAYAKGWYSTTITHSPNEDIGTKPRHIWPKGYKTPKRETSKRTLWSNNDFAMCIAYAVVFSFVLYIIACVLSLSIYLLM